MLLDHLYLQYIDEMAIFFSYSLAAVCSLLYPFHKIGHLCDCDNYYNYQNSLLIFFCQISSGSCSTILKRE